MKGNVSLGICLMLLLSSVVVVTAGQTQPFAGPNYMGFSTSSQHKNIGSGTFTTTIWVDVHSAIDTMGIGNLTFQPARIVNYTSQVKGHFFDQALIDNPDWSEGTWKAPSSGGIKNAAGYVKYWAWAIYNSAPPPAASVNNTNGSLSTITWTPRACGKVTLTITSDAPGDTGTLLGGTPIGTTYYPLTIWIHPLGITGFTATKVNGTKIHLGTWTKNTGDDKTLIRYNIGGTYPTSVTDGTLLYNGSGTSTDHIGLSAGQTVYYSAWGWNETGGLYSQTYSTAYTSTNNPPAFGTPIPGNNSINQPKSFTWSIPISDADVADSITWTLQCSNGQQTSGSGAGGSKPLSVGGLAYSTTYKVWANATDGIDAVKAWYQFTTMANIAPVLGAPSPSNGSTGRPYSFTWSIPINDGNGDTLSGTIQCSNGQSATITGTNGTKSLSITGLSKLTTYTVWVNASDGSLTTRGWYTFQTMDNLPPTFGTPSPTNGSSGNNLALTWQITISDPESNAITSWSIQCSNGQSRTGAGSSGLSASLSLTGLAFSTVYKVWVNATDGPGGSGQTTRKWYTFTTKGNSAPLLPDFPLPSNHMTNVEPDIGGLLIRVRDPDSQSMTVRFYWGNGTLIGTRASVTSGQFAIISIPDLLENHVYYWYVNVSDGFGGYIRGPAAGNYSFTTGTERRRGGHHEGESDVVILILEGSTPVNGAVITINSGASTQSIGAIVQTASTGEDGVHRFTLASGDYVITVVAPGLQKYQQLLTINGGTVTIKGDITPLTTTGLASLVVYMNPAFDIWPYFLLALIILLIILGYLWYRHGKKPWYQK